MLNAIIHRALQSISEAEAAARDLELLRASKNPGLKPCPFCGGPARVRCEDRPDPPARYQVLFVSCMDCGARTKDHPIGNYYGMDATPEEVAEVWNRRPPHEENPDAI